MNLLWPYAKKKVQKRRNGVKRLAGLLEANYCDYLTVNAVMNRFPSLSAIEDIENSNIVFGIINGYSYCFVESFHIRKRKGDHSEWKSKLIFKTKESFPDFHLITKSSAILDYLGGILFGLFFFLVPIFVMFASKSAPVVAVISCVYGFVIISYFLIKLKDVFLNDKFGIKNRGFKEKYVIFTKSNPNNINRVFTEEVCSKILDYPYDIDIKINNQEIIVDFDQNEKLSYPLCKEYLNSLVREVKILEGDFELL